MQQEFIKMLLLLTVQSHMNILFFIDTDKILQLLSILDPLCIYLHNKSSKSLFCITRQIMVYGIICHNAPC